MAAGYPVKANYATGDVLTAANMNDLSNTVNYAVSTTPTTATQMAGKNKIINGDFFINQRAFTSNTAALSYNFDRWYQSNGGTSGTLTVTPQTFTAGTAPVAGYEARNYVQCVTAAGANTDTYALYNQKIEDVRTLAGNTATISFWAKAGSGTPKIAVELEQSFGTGGSPSSTVYTAGGTVTLSTSWTRYSVTISVPSLTGKTVGTTANTSYLGCNLWLSAGTDFATRASSIGLQNATFQIWGVQLEAGSTATAFQTATGTIQGELAACQRYYFRLTPSGINYPFGFAQNYTTTTGGALINFPVTMRIKPTALEQSGTAANYQVYSPSGTTIALSTVPTFAGVVTTEQIGAVNYTVASGLTAGYVTQFAAANASGYLGWSAEL